MSNLNLYNNTTGQWEEIKIDTKLNVLKNTVTLSAPVYWIYIGISNYNPSNDTLYVVKDGKVL
ncbi:MAG: hypothetical protein Q8880_13540, partial [Bacteroidota bacterium]|nr:hypothetical protein [Bacteroidota bacterium]